MTLPIFQHQKIKHMNSWGWTDLKPLAFIFLVLLLPAFAYSSDTNERPIAGLSLQELLDETLSKNQQLISAEEAAKRYTSRIPLIDVLSEPLMAYYYQGYPISNMGGGQVEQFHQGTLKKGITYSSKEQGTRGKILTGRDMVENLAFWYEHSADDLRLQLSKQVREAFFQVYFLDQIIKVTQNSLTTLASLNQACDTQYSVGKIRQKDLLDIQLQSYQFTARLIELKQQRKEWVSNLNYLAGRAVAGEIVPWIEGGFSYENLVEPEYSAASLISGLIRNRPLVKGYQALGARFRAMRGMAKMYSSRDIKTEAWAEADFGLRAMKAEGTDFYNKTSADIKISMDNLVSYRELARLYGRVLVPQARQLYQTNLADFVVGIGDYRETLSSLLDLDQFQVKYYEALSDYQVDMARLEGLSGVPLNEPRR